MKKIYINRFYANADTILGTLILEELDYPLYTCENKWFFNAKNESCIPEGVYILEPHYSKKFKKCFIIKHVRDRTNILIHQGNTCEDTFGCILPGMQTGAILNKPAVLQSKKTMQLLVSLIKEKRELHIRSKYV